MNKETQDFVDSIRQKIKKFKINTTLKEVVSIASNTIILTRYNSGKTEKVDTGIEWFLCKKSPFYFLYNYGWIDFPGRGIIPFDIYYFQKESLFDLEDYQKIIFDKVRQCGASTLISLYCFWRANFYDAEDIDVVSVKQLKAQSFVSKMDATMDKLPNFLKTPIVKDNQQQIVWKNRSKILSESQSPNAGRSDSLSLLVLDEAAHYSTENMVRKIVASAQPTLSRTGGKFVIISCLTKNTFIFTDKGIQQIEDLLPEKYELGFNTIKQFKIDGMDLQQNCDTLYYSGKSKTIKIKTNHGIEIEGTEIHPLMTIENDRLKWRQLKDFKIGDILAIKSGMNSFGNYEEINYFYKKEVHNGKDLVVKKIDKELAYLFGIYLSEGYIYCDYKKQYKLQIAATEQDIKNKIYDFCNKYKLNYSETKTVITISSKGLIKLFEYIGFDIKKKSNNKIIPKKLLQFPKYLMVEMLNGMYDGGGCNNINSIDYSSKSIELINQLRIILLNFGIMSKTSVNKRTKVLTLLITRYKELFLNEIGFSLSRKQYDTIKKSKGREFPLFEFLSNIVNKYKLNKKILQKKGCDLYKRNNREQKNISEKTLQTFITENKNLTEVIELTELIDKNIEFTTIVDKEFSENHTYDFTIPQTHSFIANGIVSSNTPNGVAGAGAYYYEQVLAAKSDDSTKLISIDWWEIPDEVNIPGPKKGYNSKLKEAIKKNYFRNEKVKKEYEKFFNPIAENEWRNNPWLKKQMRDLGEVLYKQEILHNFIVGEHSVFNEDILKRVEKELIDPKTKNKLGNNRIDNLWIWKEPIPKHRYIIGCDISSGTGKDSSSFQIMDIETYEQVAEYKGFISTKLFGRFIKTTARYYNQAFVVIECNGIGEAVFNEVYYHDNDPYENVFKQKKTKNNVTRMTGWITDTKTRKLLTNELIDWFVVDELWEEFKVYSERLYFEMSTWVWDGTKPIHTSGGHDDAIIALALAVYLRNKVEEAGESFLINNEGKIIEYDSKDKLEESEEDTFDIFFGEEETEDIIHKRHGMNKEQYEWLVRS
jgi:intein/homing endonuclease